MKYIKLTLPTSKEKIYINISMALYVYRNVFQVNEVKTTTIEFGINNTINVLETPDEIYKLL
jgi:hypothetical protein